MVDGGPETFQIARECTHSGEEVPPMSLAPHFLKAYLGRRQLFIQMINS